MNARRRDTMLYHFEGLVLAEGFNSLTMDTIAARLRCSKSTLYSVASSKEQLVVATIQHFLRESSRKIETRALAVDRPRDRITTFLTSMSDEISAMSRDCYRDMRGFEPTYQLFQLNATALTAAVCGFIREGVAEAASGPIFPNSLPRFSAFSSGRSGKARSLTVSACQTETLTMKRARSYCVRSPTVTSRSMYAMSTADRADGVFSQAVYISAYTPPSFRS